VSAWPARQSLPTNLADRICRWSLALRGARAIADWVAMRKALGEPRTILCLGNGPSSENKSVSGIEFDCLFRVNWIWLDRGQHANPNVVFTADPDQPPDDFGGIIGFPTRADATRILAGYRRSKHRPDQRYFVFPDLPSRLSATPWPRQPTNGALMIAAAVILQPRRIVIAGVDLYLHPSGKYPAASTGPNDYDAIHDRSVDVEFIRRALDQFPGEVRIESEQLAARLAEKEGQTLAAQVD
jgi:hypothetical protein